MGYIQGTDRHQVSLLPASIEDYVSEENPVRVIDAFVPGPDMQALKFEKSIPAATGRPPFDPQVLLMLYIYGHLNKIRSSRKPEKETHRNMELMWLMYGLKPDHKTISDFRRDNKKAIKKVFKEFTLVCKEPDLFSNELFAVDGSKIRANNSRRNNYNKEKPEKKPARIEKKFEEYPDELDKNDENDQALICQPSK